MERLVVYIRGGIGDIYIAVCAVKKIQEENKISKFNTIVFTDSIYYFRDHPSALEKFSLDIINKLTPNIIEIPPWINNNFQLSIDDITDELSQENADKNLNEFMFWRPEDLKIFVEQYLYGDNTIFIDAFFTECIMEWDFKNKKYKRINNSRKIFEFKPSKITKLIIDVGIKKNKRYILIHVRKKEEGDSYTEKDNFYNEIIEYCNLNQILVILIGIDESDIKGNFIDWRGDNILDFESMAYLIDNCNVMLGNDSGFSHIKLYQQQKDKLLIMNHARFERSKWCKHMFDKSNCLLLDAKKDNINIIKKSIGEYYESK